ncbi:sugar ABC transporter substrate-binding protein [Streptomyces sp. NPDC058086]|uniref:sugar ABC transporter substrate-binding protein n=1 Tax=Streptomyces sp. NPDC058086 TaxID=3346334 RepID=UPI0036EEBEA8
MQYARPLRRAVTAAVSVGALTALAACGGTTDPAGSTDAKKSGDSDSGSKTIIFSPGYASSPALQELAKGVKAEAQKKGYTVIVQEANGSAQTQLSQLQTAVQTGQAAGVYALMLDPKTAGPLVESAQKKGVPMVVTGTPSDYGLSGMTPGITFDRTDTAAIGKALGTQLGNCINEKLGGKTEVIHTVNVPGISGAAETEAATKAALTATAPGAKIVAKIQAAPDTVKAQTDIGNSLQGHPDAEAVIGAVDEAAQGAIGAFASAGKKLPCLVTAGGSPETLAKVKAGKIYALVALDYQGDLKQAMDALFKLVKDPAANGEQLTVPQKITKAGQ